MLFSSLLVAALLYGAVAALFVYIAIHCKRSNAAPIGVAVAGLHGVIYSIAAMIITAHLVTIFERQFLNYWSLAMRVHGLIALLGFGYWYIRGGKNEC